MNYQKSNWIRYKGEWLILLTFLGLTYYDKETFPYLEYAYSEIQVNTNSSYTSSDKSRDLDICKGWICKEES